MSYTVTLQQRIQQLKKAQADLPRVLAKTARTATMRAVEAAIEATPPKMDSLRWTHTRTGELKQRWATDSVTEPRVAGAAVQTELNNNKNYASYVDQGHRMDRHFVPGLYVDENGTLNYDPTAKGGLVVGTKTKYVKGEFMADKGKEAYEKTVLAELDKEIGRLME